MTVYREQYFPQNRVQVAEERGVDIPCREGTHSVHTLPQEIGGAGTQLPEAPHTLLPVFKQCPDLFPYFRLVRQDFLRELQEQVGDGGCVVRQEAVCLIAAHEQDGISFRSVEAFGDLKAAASGQQEEYFIRVVRVQQVLVWGGVLIRVHMGAYTGCFHGNTAFLYGCRVHCPPLYTAFRIFARGEAPCIPPRCVGSGIGIPALMGH